jgi:hypothetical protein
MDMAAAMGIELLTEEEYQELQKLGDFDLKTSSWVKTPADIRKIGGALYCDRRYGRVFVGHNGAQSYYSASAFRGSLRVWVWAAIDLGGVAAPPDHILVRQNCRSAHSSRHPRPAGDENPFPSARIVIGIST